MGPDGQKAVNGFEALKKYDSNGDGFIDASDPIFSQLVLWGDANVNGTTESGELHTLREMGITEWI